MRIFFIIFFYFFVGISWSTNKSSSNQSVSAESTSQASSQLIVRLSSPAVFQKVKQQLRVDHIKPLLPQIKTKVLADHFGLSRLYLLEFSQKVDLTQKYWQCKDHPQIEAVAYNYIRFTQSIEPNDTSYKDQWNLEKIAMREAWEIDRGNSDVIIAVIDTGVDYTHEDLKKQMWRNNREIDSNQIDDDSNGYIDDMLGWDFTQNDNKPMDETGHGTHVAGIIGAEVDNRIGIAGVAWKSRIMAIRVGSSSYYGGVGMRDSNSAAGIIYAADNGAKVINMSWGSDRLSFVIRDALAYARASGVLLVAAAGNDMKSDVIYPAGYQSVLAVASGNQQNERFYQSNFGSRVNIVAPGNDILSTHIRDNYRLLSGTSMAAPHVAGVAALMLSKRPNLTAEEIRQILVSSAQPMPKSPEFSGAGYLLAPAALRMSISLQSKITSPITGTGSDKQIEVRGSAGGFGFQKWQLRYGRSTTPTDWTIIKEDYLPTRKNQVLAIWQTTFLPEDSYTLQLVVKNVENIQITDNVVVQVDHSPPILQNLTLQHWLAGDRYVPVVFWSTLDMTINELHWKPIASSNWQNRHAEATVSREHIFWLPDLPAGDYKLFAKSTNLVGLTTEQLLSTQIKDSRIPNFQLDQYTLGLPPLHLANSSSPIDFDGDGQVELVGLPLSGTLTKGVQIYERNKRGLFPLRHTIPTRFWPVFVGDLNQDRQIEIVGYDDNQVFVMTGNKTYPDQKIWTSDLIEFAQVFDLDQNGRPEIVGPNNYSGQVLGFESGGNNTFDLIFEIKNPSQGTNVIKQIATGDLNGDGKNELVFGDSEGEVFVYTDMNSPKHRLVWEHNLPIQDIRLVAVGDMTGDKIDDFIVGGQTYQPELPSIARQWKLYAFTYRSHNKGFHQIWSQSFVPYTEQLASLKIVDLNQDSTNELVVAISPHAYIYDQNFKPIWTKLIYETPNILTTNFSEGNRKGIYVNQSRQAVAWFWPKTTVANVWGLTAKTSDPKQQRKPTIVQLNWQSSAQRFTIYRAKGGEESWQEIGTSQSKTFKDFDFQSESTYRYVVSVSNSDLRSNEVEVVISSQSQLETVQPLSQSQVSVLFADRLNLNLWEDLIGRSIFDPQNYHLSPVDDLNVKQQPTSVVLDQSDRRLLLTFSHLDWEKNYRLDLSTGEYAEFITPPDIAQPTNLERLVAYPNPVRPNEMHKGAVTFANLPTNSQIHIYNLSGILIQTLSIEPEDLGKKQWYLQNNRGFAVASGLYLYLVQHKDQQKIGKIAVVK